MRSVYTSVLLAAADTVDRRHFGVVRPAHTDAIGLVL